jgi:hypothetical protein
MNWWATSQPGSCNRRRDRFRNIQRLRDLLQKAIIYHFIEPWYRFSDPARLVGISRGRRVVNDYCNEKGTVIADFVHE